MLVILILMSANFKLLLDAVVSGRHLMAGILSALMLALLISLGSCLVCILNFMYLAKEFEKLEDEERDKDV